MSTFKIYRGTQAQRAASVLVVDPGSLVITDEGVLYVGDGVTQAKSLISAPAVALSGTYVPQAGGTLTGDVISQDGTRLASITDILIYAVALGG